MTIVGIVSISFLMLGFVSDANTSANEENQKFLTMKVVETQVSYGSFIIIADENGKQEVVELEKLQRKASFVNNVLTINKTLNRIGNNGYKLVSQSAGGSDQYFFVTTYTFVKK